MALFPQVAMMPEARSVDAIELELLLQAIFERYSYDFRQYSRASLQRRVALAMERLGTRCVSDMQGRLLRDAAFFGQLLDYLTVRTTHMFRDPQFFRSLREDVLPYLKTWPSIRVWVAGASTGEEVYSLAIAFHEAGLLERARFYATDISPRALEAARRGIYRIDVVRDGSVNYQLAGGLGSLSDYYSAAYGMAQFDPDLVRNCVFSDHSLATDSAFAEVHLVTCRNVLIYFDRPLQDRAIRLFSDALVHNGFLGLGEKETLDLSSHAGQYRAFVERRRIYQRL